MLETLLHFLGLCPDAHAHLDLLDLLVGGLAGFGTIAYATCSGAVRAIRCRCGKIFCRHLR